MPKKDNMESLNLIFKERNEEILNMERRNNRTYVKIKCCKGHVTERIWNGRNKISGCKYCQRENNKKWKKEDIIKLVEDEGYGFIDMINDNGLTSRIVVWCKNPKHKPYEVIFGNFKGNKSKHGTRCEKCMRSKWDKESIISIIENEGYKFIRFIEFEKVLSRIEVECEKGHVYNVRFSKFLEGIRCPYCNESKGEKEVGKILDKYNIEYQKQYRFEDCKLKYPLPFDFYLPQYNICIEFDGLQHKQISEYFGGLDKFISIVISDTVKNDYCERNNIKLIRIPYNEMKNIEKIIVNELELE